MKLAVGERARLYIAGPMTGLPEHNYPAFMEAERQLREAGFEVENPATDGQVDGWTWADYMRRALAQLIRCHGVALLPGWASSRGARLEDDVARALGMPRRITSEWLQGAGTPTPAL